MNILNYIIKQKNDLVLKKIIVFYLFCYFDI
jgi:hypothetical protein